LWFLLFTFSAGFSILKFGLRDKVDSLSSAISGTCQRHSVPLNTSQFPSISTGDEYVPAVFQRNAVKCLSDIIGENRHGNEENYQNLGESRRSSEAVNRLLSLHHAAVNEYADRVTAEMMSKTRAIIHKYDRITDEVASTHWLLFPVSLFNTTRKQREMEFWNSLRSSYSCCTDCGEEVSQNYNCTQRGELNQFLEIFQSERIHLLIRASEDRYRIKRVLHISYYCICFSRKSN
jgi:hypothetical protein